MAKESIITDHGSDVINMARAKQLLQGLKDSLNKTIQLETIPQDWTSLLAYAVEDPLDSTKTVTKTFKVGDRVIVTDQENGDEEYDHLVVYTLVKLYKDGNTDKALWAPGGAGGPGGAAGKVKVNLEAYVNDAKTAGLDLSGLTVTLTNTTDNVEVGTKTWAGETLVFTKVTPLKNYSVSVQQKTGYTAPAAQTITNLGIGEEITKTFQYEADEYTVGIDSNQSDKTDIAQAKVTYAGTPYGNGETFKVPKGTTVSLTASAMSDVTGYAKTLTQSGKTISAVYSANVYTVRFLSNQDTQQAADADLDRTSSGVQGYVRYQYGGETVTGGKVFHDGDTIKIPTDADTQYIELYNISNKTSDGYSNAISYDHVNKVLTGTYSTTKVFLAVTASQGDVVTGNTFKINGTNITPNDNTSFVKVPTGDSITVTAPDVSGYGKVITGGGTASGTSQTVTATYTYGVLRLTVSMSDSSAADLANVAPQISVNSGDAVAMTGSNGVFEVNLDVNDTYEITFNSLVAAGYQTPSSISGTFGGGLEEKSATYQTTILTLTSIVTTKNGSVQGSNPQGVGMKVEYTGQTAAATLTTVNDTVKVPSNLTPTLTPSTVYGYQASASNSSGSITLTYATVAYALTVQTNQSVHTDIAQTVIRVSGTGISVNGYLDFTGAQNATEVLVPANVTPTAACQSGQPNTAEYRQTISVDSTNHAITAQYDTEVLTVTLAQQDGSDSDISSKKATVKAGQTTLGTLESGESLKIAYGTEYAVEVADVQGYTTPTTVTRTAQAASNSVTMTWVYNPIMYCYVKIDQTQSGDTSMITVSDSLNGVLNGTNLQTLNASTGKHANEALQAIRDSSHLYMGTFANSKMTLRQLKDNDGTKYLDGTTANMNGNDGDHYLHIGNPPYIKRVQGSDGGNVVIYGLAVGGQPDSSWKQIITAEDLLGVHEAIASDTGNNTTGVLYSKSGSVSTANVSQANFKQKARNKGTGFTIVTWEWHCVMQLLFYAWYGRTNAQAQCGKGSNTNSRTLGTKDSLGMTDTTTDNGEADNTKFWGIENWWGCKYEWIDNVAVQDRVWTVTDVKTGTTRNAGTASSESNSWITKMMLSANLDFIPTANTGGSETTYYCDYYYSNTGSRVVARSYYDAYAFGGVACVNANFDSSRTYANFGSRLAFHGTIEIA